MKMQNSSTSSRSKISRKLRRWRHRRELGSPTSFSKKEFSLCTWALWFPWFLCCRLDLRRRRRPLHHQHRRRHQWLKMQLRWLNLQHRRRWLKQLRRRPRGRHWNPSRLLFAATETPELKESTLGVALEVGIDLSRCIQERGGRLPQQDGRPLRQQ